MIGSSVPCVRPKSVGLPKVFVGDQRHFLIFIRFFLLRSCSLFKYVSQVANIFNNLMFYKRLTNKVYLIRARVIPALDVDAW